MRGIRCCAIVFGLLVLAGGPLEADDTPTGIRWETDFEQALALAAREGRPILIALNLLEEERANQLLASTLYKSRNWGDATRGYVCLVCGPNAGSPGKPTSARYPEVPDATEASTLAYVMKRFGNNLISPQHIILEPDGALAYRKEYYERVVGPRLFRAYLCAIAPPTAFARAGVDHESEIQRLLAVPTPELAAQVKALLQDGTGSGPATLLNVLDETDDKARRTILIAALGGIESGYLPLVQWYAAASLAWPDDEGDAAIAFAKAITQLDAPAGSRAFAQALARSEAQDLRTRLIDAWTGGGGLDAIPSRDRAMAKEALLLAGDARAARIEVEAPSPEMKRRLERAAGKRAPVADLRAVIENRRAPTARVREALLTATTEQLTPLRAFLLDKYKTTPYERVRIAIATTFLATGVSADWRPGLSAELLRAAFDPIEGPATRRAIAHRVGEDPGESYEFVQQLIATALAKEAR